MNDGGFKVHEIKCPSCDGSLQVPDGTTTIVCQYCGGTVHVSCGDGAGESCGIEADGTIRDRTTGYGLFRARIADGWQVMGTELRATGTSSRPYIPHAELRDRADGRLSLAVGEAGTRFSARMNALMSMYGAHLAGIDHANYADIPHPISLADGVMDQLAESLAASSVRITRQFGNFNLERKRQFAFARFQRFAQAQGGAVVNPFIGVVLRVYDCMCAGQPWRAAVYVALSACKDGSGVGEGPGGIAEGLSGLVGGIGNLFGSQFGNASAQGRLSSQGQLQPQSQHEGIADFFMGGGLLGKMKRDRQARANQVEQFSQQPQLQQQSAYYQQQPQQQMSQAGWCIPDFASYSADGTVFWSVDSVITFAAPAGDFDAQFETMFLPLVASFELHSDVDNLAMQVAMREAAQIGQATQTQLAQNQAAFNAQQEAHRQQQAAFDAYNQSISDARDARHAQFMAASHTAQAHAAPDFSEAIRGVNTYMTSDGRDVEVSVRADRAFENASGDVIGTSGSFDPGADWAEIPRR